MRIFRLFGLAAVALMALSGSAFAAGDAEKGKADFTANVEFVIRWVPAPRP